MSIAVPREVKRQADPDGVDLDWLGPAYEGSVIIPAHDEAHVIGRTLAGLSSLVREGRPDVVVVCNGCTDATAEVARRFPHVTVVEIETASKVAALNAGDAIAESWPRVYLDADVEITPLAVRAVFEVLHHGSVLAARPPYRYAFERCSPPVRAYYRARSRMPAMSEHLWGAGAYALSEAGHARLGRFPDVAADDLYVDRLFDRREIAIVATEPVIVRCPRTTAALVRTLRRVYAGRRQVEQDKPEPAVGGVGAVLRTVRRPKHLVDAGVYVGIVVVAKLAARRRAAVWLRDETNRSAGEGASPRAPISSRSADSSGR